MSTAVDQLELLAPALAFLLAAVPLAHLLGELGFFAAVARRLAHRARGIGVWWLLATVTTIVLNLDTTVVLLTPLYIQIARRRDEDPLVLAVVPLLLANLASSVLPVSNLTNLIAAERFDLHAGELIRGLGPATVAMVVVGFVLHRRWASRRVSSAARAATADAGDASSSSPTSATSTSSAPPLVGALTPLVADDGPAAGAGVEAGSPHDAGLEDPVDDRRALVVGGIVVAALLVAFVLGPLVGVAPWEAVVVADLVLVATLRTFPWRTMPLGTAAAVAVLGIVVALVVPGDRLGALVDHPGAVGAITGAFTAAALSAAVDNLPALLAMLQGIDRAAVLPVLLGVNAGAVLTPIGSLANLLWLRTVRARGVAVTWRQLWAIGAGVGGPAFLVGVAVLAIQRGLGG